MTVVGPAGCEVVGTAARSRAPEEPISTRQPAVGLLGLVVVVPIAAALAIGAGGEGSVRILAPIITYSLPLVVMVAFWWADWPGTRFRAGKAGALVLTGLGQTLPGHLDPAGLFDPSPGPGHAPTFLATMPLGGTAFVAMLQLTLVGEGPHSLPAHIQQAGRRSSRRHAQPRSPTSFHQWKGGLMASLTIDALGGEL